MEKKPSTKQTLIAKIKREKGISKGLSKLSMKELTMFDKTGVPSIDFLMSAGTLKDKSEIRKVLKLITRARLVRLVGDMRIKNYSKLKYDDLVNLIADKHWGSFHEVWMNKAKTDTKFLPDTYYSNTKPEPNPKKSEPKPEPKPKKSEAKKSEAKSKSDKKAANIIKKFKLKPRTEKQKAENTWGKASTEKKKEVSIKGVKNSDGIGTKSLTYSEMVDAGLM
jgi:hypothetical protein